MSTTNANAELFRVMGEIANDETLMAKLLKYAKKLAAQKNDPTLMTEEEFFAKVAEAEEQYERGEYTTLMPDESVSDMLKRSGYAL